MRELLRIGGMNVYDLLEEHFRSDALKGALGFDAVLGTNFGPRSPGTVLTLLYRMAAEAAGGRRGLAQPIGRHGRAERGARQGRGRGRRRPSAPPRRSRESWSNRIARPACCSSPASASRRAP